LSLPRHGQLAHLPSRLPTDRVSRPQAKRAFPQLRPFLHHRPRRRPKGRVARGLERVHFRGEGVASRPRSVREGLAERAHGDVLVVGALRGPQRRLGARRVRRVGEVELLGRDVRLRGGLEKRTKMRCGCVVESEGDRRVNYREAWEEDGCEER
jgi:hypothetical protein